MRVRLIDNYDSFTWNLVQVLRALGADVTVTKNDGVDVDGLRHDLPDALAISAGPCAPDDAGVSLAAIDALAGAIPILGVCLGHQAIAQAFGGSVVRAARPMHGKTSPIFHDGRGLFASLPCPFPATRYHSLIVDPVTLPTCLEVSAWTADGEIMGLRHRTRAIDGVQFHPESILTPDGEALMANWLERVRAESAPREFGRRRTDVTPASSRLGVARGGVS